MIQSTEFMDGQESKGKIPLIINLTDDTSGYKIDFRSKKFSVSVGQPLIDAVNKLQINYSFSRK